MQKLLLLIVLILIACSITPGGFSPVDNSDLPSLANNDIYRTAEQEARQVFSEKHNSQLGAVVAVQQQVVAGINYKITFESPEGLVDVTVFTQPWTNTVKVIDIQEH